MSSEESVCNDDDSDSSDIILNEFAFDLEEQGMAYLQTMPNFKRKKYGLFLTTETTIPIVTSLLAREDVPKLKSFLQSVDEMDENEFFSHFRITLDTFSQLLSHVTSNYLKDNVDNGGGHQPIGPKPALFMTLFYLGKKCPYGEVASMFGVSKSTVYKHTFIVMKIIANMAQSEIRWPSFESCISTEQEFLQIAGLPGVVGVMDTCRINIKAPHTDLLCETERHSMILLAVCDARKRFVSTYVAYPGNTHDQQVLLYSPLGKSIETRPHTLFPNGYYHLVADEAFTLNTHIVVPYREQQYNLHVQQRNYNTKLMKTKSVIDNAFWYLKGRCKRLMYIDAEYERIPLIITAACVLHNISLNQERDRELLINDIKDFTLDNQWPMGFVGYDGTDVSRSKRDHLAFSY